MSNLYIPEDEMLKSSPALPHLQTCIEAVAREAIQSGCPEQDVRQILRHHDQPFEGILAALHGAYRLHPSLRSTEVSATNESSNRPRSSLLPAAEIEERQPSGWRDTVHSDKVEDGPDDDDDDLAVDEDAKKAGDPQEGHPHAPHPRVGPSYAERRPVIAASGHLNQALGLASRTPGSSMFTAGFAVGATVGRSPDSDDGSDTTRQGTFVPSWPPRRLPASLLGASPFAEDKDAQPSRQAPAAVHHSAPHPYAILPVSGRDKITDAAGRLLQAEERDSKPLESPAARDDDDDDDDGSDTPRQKTFANSSPSPGPETIIVGNSAFTPDAAGLSAVPVDPEQAKSNQGKAKVSAWDDGQSLLEVAMVDPNSLDARHRSFDTANEPKLLLDTLTETKRLESPDAKKLAFHANDPAQLEKSIRQAADAKKAGEQTTEAEEPRQVLTTKNEGHRWKFNSKGFLERMKKIQSSNSAGAESLDATSAEINATTPEDTAEMIDEPLRNSTNDAAPDGGDDKDVDKTKSSPVTEAARAQMGRDADARAEGWEAKQKGKGREKAREARRSPERRS